MTMDEVVRLLTSGVIGGFVGAFLGGFSKFFWERWLPDQLTWRREQVDSPAPVVLSQLSVIPRFARSTSYKVDFG